MAQPSDPFTLELRTSALPGKSPFLTSDSVYSSDAGSAALYLYSISTIHCSASVPPWVLKTALPFASRICAPLREPMIATQSQIRPSACFQAHTEPHWLPG